MIGMEKTEPNPAPYPTDPTGIEEPHDVLAAEEFPMPAGGEPHAGSGGVDRRAWAAPLAAAAVLVLLVVRRRR
jgi:hypothetical protein